MRFFRSMFVANYRLKIAASGHNLMQAPHPRIGVLHGVHKPFIGGPEFAIEEFSDGQKMCIISTRLIKLRCGFVSAQRQMLAAEIANIKSQK